MEGITIREYETADHPALIGCMEGLCDYIVGIDQWKRCRRIPEYGETYVQLLLQKVERHKGKIYVALKGEEFVGCAVGLIEEQTQEGRLEEIPTLWGTVQELYVAEHVRGSGVGMMLMEHIEKYFRESVCTAYRVDCFAPNKRAHSFYEKLGYEDWCSTLVKHTP